MIVSPAPVALLILLAVMLWLARYRRRRNWLYVSVAISRLYLAGVFVVLWLYPETINTEHRALLLRLGLLALFTTEIVANVTAMVAEHVGIKYE